MTASSRPSLPDNQASVPAQLSTADENSLDVAVYASLKGGRRASNNNSHAWWLLITPKLNERVRGCCWCGKRERYTLSSGNVAALLFYMTLFDLSFFSFAKPSRTFADTSSVSTELLQQSTCLSRSSSVWFSFHFFLFAINNNRNYYSDGYSLAFAHPVCKQYLKIPPLPGQQWISTPGTWLETPRRPPGCSMPPWARSPRAACASVRTCNVKSAGELLSASGFDKACWPAAYNEVKVAIRGRNFLWQLLTSESTVRSRSTIALCCMLPTH